MPDQSGTDDKFVEIEGVKYKADPDNIEEALMGEDDKPIPFEVKETEDQKKERERIEKEESDKDPPLRKSAKDHIIRRKDKKIKKLEKKKGEEGEEGEFTPEGEEEINKKIREGLEPILDQVRGNSDDQELQVVLDKYPEAKKIEKTIRKYMEAYKNTPVEFIYLGLAKQMIDKAERLKKKKEEADDEALKDTTGGTQKRPKRLPKIPDVTNMTDEQVLALAKKVRTGQFK